MPVNKYALLRYRIIDRKIGSKYNRFPTKEDLRQACEDELYGSSEGRISLSTIEKDLYAMRNEENLGYFAPIAFDRLNKGYYYTDPDYTIQDIPLNDEDLDAIAFAANTLSQFKGLDMFKTSEAAIDKILNRFNLNPHGKETVEHLQFETAETYKGGNHLPIILEAINQNKVISFDYEKFTGSKKRSYLLHPYLLKEYRNRWYVIGHNPEKEIVVVFGLDRVVGEVEKTETSFERRADFSPENYFEHSIGITSVNDDPEKIHLRFSPLSGKYIESQPLHSSQKIIRNDEVALEIELFLCVTKELIMTIMSYGADVEVKAPEALRKKIANNLKNALKIYE